MRNQVFTDRISGFTDADDVRKTGYYPFFREIISEQDTEVYLKGNRKVIMFGSNSYMGLTSHPEVKEAAVAAVRRYGTGCAGSPFLNGTLDIHHELEAELADWVGKEAAMLFSTGFQVNQGVIATIAHRHDHVIFDKFNHASIIDGGQLSFADVYRYPHNNIERLKKILASLPPRSGKLLVADGVFSMDGDIVKLPEIMELAQEHSMAIMLDDAHSLGVLGKEGRGTADHFGMTDNVDFIMGTFSKSLASIGGFVAGDAIVIDYLKHCARAFIYSASMPPASAAAALTAARIIRREPERIEQLWKNTKTLLNGLKSLGFDTRLSETPIIPIHVGELSTLLQMTRRLEEEGLFVNPVIPPAVPQNHCLIRLSVMATHTQKQIDFGLEKMEKVGRELGVIRPV